MRVCLRGNILVRLWRDFENSSFGKIDIMQNNVPQLARDVYNIEHWSEGFFDVDDQGSVVVCPGENIKVSLENIAEKITKDELKTKIQNLGLV